MTTKMVLELRDQTHEERLNSVGFTTLKRRERGDLIAVDRERKKLENMEKIVTMSRRDV